MNVAKEYLKSKVSKIVIKWALRIITPLIPYLVVILVVFMLFAMLVSFPASSIWTEEGLPSDLVENVYKVRDEVKTAENLEYYPASYVFAIDNVKRENLYDENKVILPIQEYQKTIDTDIVLEQEEICEIYLFNDVECDSLDMAINLWDNTQIDSPKISGQFVYPVHDPYVITAPFADINDVHTTPHGAVDFVTIDDHKIYSISNGEVIYANSSCDLNGYLGSTCPSDSNSTSFQMGSTGNSVLVKTELEGIPIYIVYAHMSQVNVKTGDKVLPDQPIGVIGNSGSSTGTHLHLQIRYEYNSSKYAIDPIPLLSKEVSTLPKPTAEQKQYILNAGISESEITYVNYIITRNSNWKVDHKNFITQKYGLCQISPPQLMEKYGVDYMENPVTQLKYCNEYAISKFGSWQQAYDHYAKNNHW